jgi:ribosomal protein L7Ae-like RNA K-turn-binding protein
VAPDVRARAPGRGAWIGVGQAELDAANAKGRLKGALQRAFKIGEVMIPEDLGARIADALRQSALDRLGMEARSGNLVNGAERIEAAARAGKATLLIHAADAGEDGRKRLDQAWRVGGSEGRGLVFPEDRTILSMALGRENVVHIALTDPAAARRVTHAIDRWLAFINPDAGLEGGSAAAGPGTADE